MIYMYLILLHIIYLTSWVPRGSCMCHRPPGHAPCAAGIFYFRALQWIIGSHLVNLGFNETKWLEYRKKDFYKSFFSIKNAQVVKNLLCSCKESASFRKRTYLDLLYNICLHLFFLSLCLCSRSIAWEISILILSFVYETASIPLFTNGKRMFAFGVRCFNFRADFFGIV